MDQENNCHFISSRGLLKSCDIHSATNPPSFCYYDQYIDEERQDGTVIYICSFMGVHNFVQYLDRIKFKFVLVSGDCDETVPNQVFDNNDNFLNFIQNDKILHWYCQNCIVDHPKITRLPIGLDYHTISNNDDRLGHQRTSPLLQEKDLISIKNSALPFWERNSMCYSNFHLTLWECRKEAVNNIQKEVVFYEPQNLKRMDSWKNQADYAFVISPHGHGLDCHRTWEALILGCIAIVKKSGLDPMYEDLPVLIIDDWNQITPEFLKYSLVKFKDKQFNYEKLTLEYWRNQMRTHA